MKSKWMFKFFIVVMIVLSYSVVYADAMTLNYDGAEHVYSGQPISLYVNSELVDTPAMPAIQFTGKVVVPAREIFSAAGAAVDWQPHEQKVYVNDGTTLIILTINSNEAWVNGKTEVLDMPAKLINNKVMIPVRFIGETLGYKVDWQPDTYSIHLFTPVSASNNDKQAVTEPVVDDNTNQSGLNVDSSDNEVPNTDINVNTTVDPNANGNIDNQYGNNNGFDLANGVGENWLGQEHISYDPTKEALVLKGIQGLKAAQITVDEQYHTKQIVISLNGEYGSYLQSGIWVKQQGAIRMLEVRHVDMGTQLVLTTATIQALKVSEEQGEIVLQSVKPKEKYSKIVVIDAGHGDHDSGTSAQGVREKDLVLKYANALGAKLAQDDTIKAYLTREDDSFLELTERTDFANQVETDLFISLHVNSPGSNNTTASGTETYYTKKEDTRNKTFAEIVQKAIVNRFGTRDRGVKTNTYVVTRLTQAPAVLVEIGFVTNDADRAMMTAPTFPEEYAQVLYQCILDYYNLGLNY